MPNPLSPILPHPPAIQAGQTIADYNEGLIFSQFFCFFSPSDASRSLSFSRSLLEENFQGSKSFAAICCCARWCRSRLPVVGIARTRRKRTRRRDVRREKWRVHECEQVMTEREREKERETERNIDRGATRPWQSINLLRKGDRYPGDRWPWEATNRRCVRWVAFSARLLQFRWLSFALGFEEEALARKNLCFSDISEFSNSSTRSIWMHRCPKIVSRTQICTTKYMWDGQILGKGTELSPVPNNCNQMSQVAYCRES